MRSSTRSSRSLSATERLEALCAKKGLALVWEGPTRSRGIAYRFGLTITREGGAYVADASIVVMGDRWTPETRDDLASALLSETAAA